MSEAGQAEDAAGDRERHPLAMDTLVSLCAAKGFIYPASEIYGGINGFWDYGPLGVELKNNLKARLVAVGSSATGTTSRASIQLDHQRTRGPGKRRATWSTSATRWSTAAPASGASGPTRSRIVPTVPRRPEETRRSRTATSPRPAQLQPDADDADRRLGRRRRSTAYLRSRDLPADLQRLQARARVGATEGSLRHRPDRQGVPQRDHAAELHVPLARVRAGRDGVLLSPEESRDEWFAHWQKEQRLAFHHELGFDPSLLRTRPHADDELAHYARAADGRRVPFPLRLAGDRRASTIAATGTSRGTASIRARNSRSPTNRPRSASRPMVSSRPRWASTAPDAGAAGRGVHRGRPSRAAIRAPS